MSIDLSTGTNSYVSLGDAVNVVNTFPLTLAAVFQSASIPSGLIGLFSEGKYSANHGWGSFLYTADKKAGVFWAPPAAPTFELDGLRSGVAVNNGWYLLVINLYLDGANVISKNIFYSYTDASWSTVETLAAGGVGTSIEPPVAGETTVVGANNISGVANYLGVPLSWIAIWADDFGGANLATDDRTLDLIENGAWGEINNDYILFLPFTNAATDQSSNHFDGTVQGGATYSAAGPGELPSAIDLVVADATQALSIDGLELTQVNSLAVADMLHTLSIDGLELTQVNSLAVADLLHTLSIDGLALTQVNNLSMADMLHTLSITNIVFYARGLAILSDAATAKNSLADAALYDATVSDG